MVLMIYVFFNVARDFINCFFKELILQKKCILSSTDHQGIMVTKFISD